MKTTKDTSYLTTMVWKANFSSWLQTFWKCSVNFSNKGIVQIREKFPYLTLFRKFITFPYLDLPLYTKLVLPGSCFVLKLPSINILDSRIERWVCFLGSISSWNGKWEYYWRFSCYHGSVSVKFNFSNFWKKISNEKLLTQKSAANWMTETELMNTVRELVRKGNIWRFVHVHKYRTFYSFGLAFSWYRDK